MTGRESFEDALDAAIDALRAGRPLDRVLADHPGHAASLAPVLDSVLQATANGGGYLPPSPRLAEHVTIVRAAAQRAQMAAMPSTAPATIARGGSWWNRRLTFASLSIPAGIAVFALGASGAAAAAGVAAMTTDVPSQFARAAMPSWVEDAVPGLGGHDDAVVVGASPTATAEGVAPSGDKTETPGDVNRPTLVEVDGVVSDINGNTFTLTDGDDAWRVQIDSHTIVDGEIAEGAEASVSGDVTAGKNLHADDVTVTTPAPTPTIDEGAKPEKTPPGADKTPGPPEKTPKPETTPGPPEVPTPRNPDPPGQSSGQGAPESNGSDGDNGSDGGNSNGRDAR